MSRRYSSQGASTVSESLTNEARAYPFSNMQNNYSTQHRGPIEGPYGCKLVRRLTWRHSSYKFMASLWVLGVFYLVWLIRDMFYFPFSSSFVADPFSPVDDYFAQYLGRQECAISSRSLYAGEEDASIRHYCRTRTSLLDAMSNGGRIGFDASYASRDCSYRWYSTAQICRILEKLDGIIFVGDQSLANVFAGFNILLREDLASGSLKDWEMSPEQVKNCTCESQFSNASCLPLRISSSDEVNTADGTRRPYVCPIDNRHVFIAVDESPAAKDSHSKFRRLIAEAAIAGQKKPIPVIHSLSHSTSFSVQIAMASMVEWHALAKASGRDTPFLWVGPTAPGQQRSSKPSDGTVWQYSLDTAEAARNMRMDTLGMYNATLQAESFDGTHYGERVSLLQAMMIINWLSTL